jgi:hypothetical protein
MREINVACSRVGLLILVRLLPVPQFRKATFYIYLSVLDKDVLIYFEYCNVKAPLCLLKLQYKYSLVTLLYSSFNLREARIYSYTHFIAETTNINTLQFVGLGRLISPFSVSKIPTNASFIQCTSMSA